MISPLFYLYCAHNGRCYPRPSGFVPSKTKRAPAPPPILEPVEVAIHNTYETQQTTQNTPSIITLDGMVYEEPTGLGRDLDLERGAEN